MFKRLCTINKRYHITGYIAALCIAMIIGVLGITYLLETYPIISRVYDPQLVLLTGIIAVLCVWSYFFFTSCREASYKYLTNGRSYSSDYHKFNRCYASLLRTYGVKNTNAYMKDYFPIQDWRKANGLIFGKTTDGRLIHFEPEKNGICAAIWGAPGDGKTTSTIIPSARQFGMDYSTGNPVQNGSVMVTDIKGDIFDANKDYRRIKRFSTIHPEESAHYDPLLVARQLDEKSRVEFIENQAVTIIPSESGSDGAYWADVARDFYTGIVLYELHNDPAISFPTIMDKIALIPFTKYGELIEISDCVEAQKHTNQYKDENPNNVGGGYSKLIRNTRIFTNPTLSKLLVNDGDLISPDDLENCIDIYIQIDTNEMATIGGPVIAMIYEAFMSNALRRKQHQNPPIAYIIDEFGQIPAMPIISRSAALMRGFNCSILICCQSLSMIEKHYGHEGRKELMDCVKAHGFLSIMDPDTREWAAKMIGKQKELVLSNSIQNTNSNVPHSGINVAEQEHWVINPEDFGVLPDNNDIFIYYRGKYIKGKLTPFYYSFNGHKYNFYN